MQRVVNALEAGARIEMLVGITLVSYPRGYRGEFVNPSTATMDALERRGVVEYRTPRTHGGTRSRWVLAGTAAP